MAELQVDVPGEEFIDALGRVIRDAGDETTEMRVGVDVVESGCFDDRVPVSIDGLFASSY